MPLKKEENACEMAEKFMDSIRNKRFKTANTSVADYLTLSVGVTTIEANEEFDWNRLYTESDQALYYAKNHGRNRAEEYREGM